MTKRSPHIHKKRSIYPAGKRGRLIIICVLLSFIITGGIFAEWSSLSAAQKPRAGSKPAAPTSPTTMSLEQSNSVKDYIYAGNRLIATEEPCAISLSPISAFFPLVGQEGSVNVTAAAGCNWTAVASDSWITIESAASGSGSDVISYAVRDNFDPVPRQGTITVNGQVHTIVQDSSASQECTYTINPTSISFNNAGGSGSVQVFCEERCAWQAVPDVNWITITSNNCGIGNGSINYSVAANTTGANRNGHITIGGQIFNVKQKP